MHIFKLATLKSSFNMTSGYSHGQCLLPPFFTYMSHNFLFICVSHNLLKTGYNILDNIVIVYTNSPSALSRVCFCCCLIIYLMTWLDHFSNVCFPQSVRDIHIITLGCTVVLVWISASFSLVFSVQWSVSFGSNPAFRFQ